MKENTIYKTDSQNNNSIFIAAKITDISDMTHEIENLLERVVDMLIGNSEESEEINIIYTGGEIQTGKKIYSMRTDIEMLERSITNIKKQVSRIAYELFGITF